MEPIKIALIGCGGMSGAHMNAFRTLWNKDLKLFDIVATCDVVEERAQERAKQAEEFQGKKPAIFTDFHDMLDKVPDIEAVDICTLHSEHHSIAVPCLEAGKHVIIEKPLGITMRACKLMLDASIRAQKVLAVAENYRLAVHERARRWAIQQGRIGKPRMFFWQDVGENLGKWGWRNFKHLAGAGWVLDGGVHFADLFRFHLGSDAREVYAITKQYEPFRYSDPKNRKGAWRVSVEDASMALISFDNDVLVQWTWVGSAAGRGFGHRVIYGSEGCIDWNGGLWLRDGTHIDNDALIKEFMESISDEQKERFFPSGITDTVAIELKDFADAVRIGTVPEVDVMEGLKDQAICMAIFESAWFNRPVSLQEIERCELEGYQKEINEALGI